MIVTFTANPSLDRTVALSGPLERGEVQRAVSVRQESGGKGVNVSRALVASGLESVAVLPGADSDPVLAGLRDRDAFSALPESEREGCEAFWSGVEALRQRANCRPWARTSGRPPDAA